MSKSKVTMLATVIVAFLLSGCGLHGPNITLEFNIDKRDQREMCDVEGAAQQPVLSREEVQELMGYAGAALDLIKKVEEEMLAGRRLREVVAREFFQIPMPETGLRMVIEPDMSDPLFE